MKWRRKSSARLPSRSCCHKPESARLLAAASPKRLMLPTWLEECGMNLTTENTKNTEMPSSSKHETKTLHEATKVAEGRGAGPRVCDPQQCPQLESLENTPTRRAASPLAAG